MALLLLSFAAGILTVLAPCVLPLLPIIIGGSLSTDKKQKSRPYIIAASLAASIIAFTLLLKASTALIDVPSEFWAYVSGGIVVVLGVVSLFPALWEKFAMKLQLQSGTNKLLSRGFQNKGKFVGPVLVGAALGPVFSSCSPTYAYILATVLPRDPLEGFIHLVVYSLGLALVLLLVAVFGRKFIQRFEWAANPHSWFRRGIGILFIVIGLLIITGLEKKFETWLVQNEYLGSTYIEQKLFDSTLNDSEDENFNESTGGDVNGGDVNDTENILNVRPTQAPEIRGIETWLNSDPLTLSELKGKVVLMDFWTYSCINCIRTLPYIEKWYETYKDKGLVIIGLHAPEFAFERKEENVRNAIEEYGLTYPVALDNDFATWRAYENQYWPAHYLIDRDGKVRYTHFGEGEYDTTEKAVQLLLGEDAPLVVGDVPSSSSRTQTPETYFGSARAKNFVGNPEFRAGDIQFSPDSDLAVNTWTLSGKWSVSDESITSQDDSAKLLFHVQAKDVYMVATSDSKDAAIGITAKTEGSWMGKDVNGEKVTIRGAELYHILSFDNSKKALVELSVPKGVSVFTFTFGS